MIEYLYQNITENLENLQNGILDQELWMILNFQNEYKTFAIVFDAIAYVTNIRFLQMFIFPLILLINTKSYVYLSLSTLLPHIVSIWLKWFFASDRPYWWLYTKSSYTHFDRPRLEQRSLTCETSSGNPSSELMMIACALHVFAMGPYKSPTEWFRLNIPKWILSQLFIGIFAFSVFGIVAVAQMFLALHFLHQCYFGTFYGIILSLFLIYWKWLDRCVEFGKLKATFVYLAFGTLSVVIYAIAFYFIEDPRQSVHKAFNWCVDPFLIRPENTSTYWIVYDYGLLFGLLMCAPINPKHYIQPDTTKTALLIVGLVLTNVILHAFIPRYGGVLIFYICTFLANAFYSSVLIKGTLTLTKHLKTK